MKMKLYYVVKKNVKLFEYEADVICTAGPFSTFAEALNHVLMEDEFVAEQEFEVK